MHVAQHAIDEIILISELVEKAAGRKPNSATAKKHRRRTPS